ncbi:MAG: hypothetical protein AAB019_10725 [Planctomycetota bacterium]
MAKNTILFLAFCIINLIFLPACSVSPEKGSQVGSKVDEKYKTEITKLLIQKKKLEDDLRLAQAKNEQDRQEIGRFLKENERLEKENFELRAKYLGDLSSVPISSATIKGKIKAINADQNLIIISVGKEAGVIQGMGLNIYRGNQMIGKMLINSVEKDWAIGRCPDLNALKQLQLGDEVSTVIK